MHILRELGVGRLVTHDANTKLYRLGSGVLSLGRELTQQNPFVQLAQPHLSRLSRDFEVGASGQERDGEDEMVVVVAASVTPGDMVSPGGRTPLLIGATGRLMAALGDFDEAELRRRFSKLRWQDAPTVKVWLEEVRGARSTGYAVDEGHFRKGITAIAAPVLNADGSAARTISVTGISAQLDDAKRKKLALAVKNAAAEITRLLR
ncbi:IclR family transcriptional regulator [Hydrogenophaga sp. BPS33]|uniref:IclR family transcriptional regulator n=1 Tax=Hydrogenophaga sp. BPS33 TaxID=2651974 RepID=UPI0013581DC7|nr:IclR family transcriptional regulator C-terminal domain-containing protein [Hydrogenophaga sp. BPS33]